MSKTKNREIYRRRQNILLVVIASILIALILILVYVMVFNDRKEITHKELDNVLSVSDSGLDSVSVDAQADANKKDIDFEKDSITVAVDKTITPKILNGTVSDITNWQSSDSSIATVNENGEIKGVGIGIAGISATVSGTDKLLTLRVEVTEAAEEETEETEETESDENNEDIDYGERKVGLTANNYEIVQENGFTYVDGILIANKSYSLPSDYYPGEDSEAVSAFYTMQSDAAYEGLDIYISSGFRSYDDQDRIYNNYASYDGYDAADRYSARPGHSEHQTGLAFDLNTIEESFAYTAEGEWVKDNCHKYGFIIRYPEGKEDITGYMYEPWHIRYIGTDKATAIYESGLTVEEYYGIDSVYSE